MAGDLLEKLEQDLSGAHRRWMKAGQTTNSQSETDRYTMESWDRAFRLRGVIVSLGMTADMISKRANQDERLVWFEIQRVHLVVHRTMMLATRDAALRFVAAIWDLGIPERVTTDAVIFGNRRMTPPVKDALRQISALVDKYAAERHDAVHAGGVPSIETNIDLGDTPVERHGALNERSTETRVKLAESIHDEAHQLAQAIGGLYDALGADYDRQFKMLSTL